MSNSTEQRVKAFLDRQKDKPTVHETRNDHYLPTEYDKFKQINTSKSFSHSKNEESLNETINTSQLNCGYNTPASTLNDQSNEHDFDKNPNNSDVSIRAANKNAAEGYRLTYEKKKALYSGELKDKIKYESAPKPQTVNTSQKKTNSANKPTEPLNRLPNLQIQSEDTEPVEHTRQRTKSPLDKFFDQKLTTKIKIKEKIKNYSKENPSMNNSKSRAKTPQRTHEDTKDRSPLISPRSKSKSPRPLRIQITEEITTPQLSPTHNKKIGSPMQLGDKKINAFRSDSDMRASKQSSNLNESKENDNSNDDGKQAGVKQKVAPELSSLDKLLKNERKRNKEGYFGGSETMSMKTDEYGLKDSSMKETSRREITPSKVSVSVSRDDIKSRSLTPRQITQRSTTPRKKTKSPKSAPKRTINGKIFEEATRTLEKLYNSSKGSYKQRGRQSEQGSNDSGQEEKRQHSEFKNEIKKVLKNINEEKEQLLRNLAEMSTKLADYEIAYNNLKIEFETYKLREKKRRYEHGNSGDLDEHEEDQLRNHKIEKRPDYLEVFSIDQLNLSPNNRASSKMRETKDDSIFGHVQAMNDHIEELMSRNPANPESQKKISSAIEIDAIKPFDFSKYPEAAWISKDMNLKMRVFNPEAAKDGTLKLAENEPKDKDEIIRAQREMIDFLYRKLLHEENQRLTTEEQAHIMISTMESSLSPLRGRRKVTENKKADSAVTPGTEDTSKSLINEKQL